MKKKLLILTPILLLLISSITIAYALIEGITRKYPTQITITNISFTYNNNSYFNDITTDNLNITKGEPLDIELKLKTTGNEKIYADYYVNLYAEETSENNTSLAKALDLYVYNGYRYEYVSTLSELTSDNKYKITGQCLFNTESTIKLQLVYNETINDAYFEESLKNTVTLRTDANATLSMSSNFYTFVSNLEEFKTAIKNTNKQIVLTSDIETDEPLELTNIGIDLNGHKLTLNKNVIFNYTSDMNSNLYIGDKKAGGSIIKGDGVSLTLSGIPVEVHNSYYDLFTVTESDNLKSSLYTIFEERIKEIPTKKEYAIGDSFTLFDGYYQYLSYIDVDCDVLEKSNNYYVIKDYSKSSNYTPILRLTINDKVLSSQILLSEVGINACLTEIKERFSSKIVNYSIPLLTYDNKSRCHIEYYINDNNNGNIFNSDGIYQASGIDYIKNLDNISVIKPTITIKVSYEHSYLTYTLTSDETINLIPLTELQIKSLIVSNEAKVLLCDTDTESSDTTLNYGDTNNAFLTSFLSKLTNSSATISNVEGNTNYTDNFNIDDIKKTIKAKDVKVNKIIETDISYKVTFTFADLVTYEFNCTNNITLLGKEEYKTRYDISNRLSLKFRENDYISGNGYNFNAYGSLSPTVNKEKKAIYIKYEIVTEAPKDFVAIIYEYNLVTKSESQVSYFAKNSDGSYLFSTSELTSATLDSNTSYFIDISSLTGFTGDRYSIESGTATLNTSGIYALAYTYEAFIQIKANLVPQVESTIVSIKATLYNDSSYTDPYLENNKEVSYTFTLTVEGIIHYGSEKGNVTDYQLYSKLLLIFDKNNDGLITYSEAKQSMSEVASILESKGIKGTYYNTDSTYNLDYLNFESLNIDSLNGLEYFSNITGISFKSNSIKSIQNLSSLHNLQYINLASNQVTDVTPLNLLDNLVYLNFESNLITDISPLKYLSNVQYINLKSNKIVDLDGLTLMTNLKYLNLCNMTKDNIEFTNNNTINYELALIQINSSSAEIHTGTNDSVYSLQDEAKTAVTILKELERINRVNQKLYLPARYYYNSTSYYDINWTCNNSNLTFTKNGSYYDFSCTNPVIDEDVEFLIQVGDKSFQRVMKVNVYKTASDTVYDKYIYNGSGYTNLTTLKDVNKTLIDALFNIYNIDKSTTTLVEVVSGTSVPEQFVISASDFSSASTITEIDLSNEGLTSLAGLEYFIEYIKSNTSISINLLGNSLDSLEKLTLLDTIGTLKIGSAKYDFNELVSGSQNEGNEKTLITISKLYVSQCYDLSDDDVIKGLFRYYFVSSNDIEIYLKDDSTKWDPYEELLPYKLTLIQNTISLNYAGDYDLSKILYTDSNGIAIDFYGYTHYFKFYYDYGVNNLYTRNSSSNYTWYSSENNIGKFYTYNDYFQFSENILTYKKYIAGEETSYLTVGLKSTTNSKKTITGEHTLAINVFDMAKNITVTGLDNNTSSTLADMFNSKELKEEILSILNTNSFDFTSGTITLTDLNTKLSSLTSFTFKQMASNYSSNLFKGLRYLTNLKSITINKDFNIGTGEDLVNLTNISVSNSYVDFSALSTTLTNLNELTLSSNYGIKLPSGLGDKLPNLETLKIDGFVSNYMDLHQLTNLITREGKSNISSLTLNKVKASSDPLTIGDVNNVIIPLRNAYYKAHFSEPTYCVGNKTSGEAKSGTNLNFVLKTDNSVDYVYVTSDTVENRWVAEISSSDKTVDTSAKLNNYKLYDFGLMIAGSTPSQGTSWLSLGEDGALKQTADTTLWLPTNTKYFLYSLYKDDTLVNNSFTYQNLDMTWYYFKHDSNEAQTKGQISGNTTDGYINYTLEGNAYYIIIGTIPSQNAMFTYQFISGSGDGVYSSFDNNNLRFITYYFAELSNRIDSWSGISFNNGAINHADFARYSGVDGLSSCTNWVKYVKDDSEKLKYIYYSNTLTISSLADYKTDVINNYLFGDNGKFQVIKTVELPDSYYDISFTNTFGKLKNVESLTCSNSSLKFDSDSFTNYTKLTSLDLSNAYNFSPSALESLTKVNTSLTTLNISGTRCDHNLDTFTVLAKWTRNTNTISITLNSNTVSTTTSNISSILSSIKGDLVTDKSYNVRDTSNALGSIYNNRTSSLEYSLNDYKIKWEYPEQFIQSIGNTSLTSSTNVPVSVLLTYSSLSIFNEVPYILYAYDAQVTTNGKFKCDASDGGLGVEELNYELIALAVKNNAVSYSNGYFVLSKDTYVSAAQWSVTNLNLDKFIVSASGEYLSLKLASDGYAIKIHKSICNELYKQYEANSLYRKSGSYQDTTYSAQSVPDLTKYEYDFASDNLPTKNSPFIYFDNNTDGNNVKLTITLPANKIVIYGLTYELKLTLEKTKYLNYGIEIDGTSVIIDSAKLLQAASQFEKNSVTEVKFQYYITKDEKKYKSGNCFTVYINHLDSTDEYIDENYLYVLAQKDDTGYYLETNSNKVYFDSSKYVLSTISNGNYILSDSGDDALINASYVFESGVFIKKIIDETIKSVEDGFTGIDLKNLNDGSRRVGKVLTNIASVSELYANSESFDFISSIKGIEYFKSLKILQLAGMIFGSLEGLENIQLARFFYNTNNDNPYVTIVDFSPLIKGSKDSLVTFQYGAKGNTIIDDLSFLLEFKNLTNVLVENMDNSDRNNSDRNRYVYTKEFAYLVYQLRNMNVNVGIKKDILNNCRYITYNSEFWGYGQAQVESTYSLGFSLLSLYNDNLSKFTLSPILENDYSIKIDKSTETTYMYLPATVENDGKLYLLNYTTDTYNKAGFISNLGYYNVSSSSEEKVTNPEELISSNDYYLTYLARTSMLYVKFKINTNASLNAYDKVSYNRIDVSLTCGVGEKKYSLSRRLTINYN